MTGRPAPLGPFTVCTTREQLDALLVRAVLSIYSSSSYADDDAGRAAVTATYVHSYTRRLEQLALEQLVSDSMSRHPAGRKITRREW